MTLAHDYWKQLYLVVSMFGVAVNSRQLNNECTSKMLVGYLAVNTAHNNCRWSYSHLLATRVGGGGGGLHLPF